VRTPERFTMRLDDVSYRGGKMQYRARHATEPEDVLPTYLDDALAIVRAASRAPLETPEPDPELPSDASALRWFPLPGEVRAELRAEAAAR
jgi:hypothetical protein